MAGKEEKDDDNSCSIDLVMEPSPHAPKVPMGIFNSVLAACNTFSSVAVFEKKINYGIFYVRIVPGTVNIMKCMKYARCAEQKKKAFNISIKKAMTHGGKTARQQKQKQFQIPTTNNKKSGAL